MTSDDNNGGNLPDLDKLDKETRKIIERLLAQAQPLILDKKPKQKGIHEQDKTENQN